MNVIVDYGVGNIGSIANMLKRLGVPSLITARPEEIETADRIILCGVGAFDDGMKKLENLGITASLRKAVLEDKKPIIGVCLGMQLLTEGSEEGNKQGLGFVKGYCKRFDFSASENSRHLKVPHMGWNEVKAVKESFLLNGMYAHPRFYFVHSYHAVLEDERDVLLTAQYGYSFAAAFEKENIIGVQFHPEKSHKYGLKLYENFVNG